MSEEEDIAPEIPALVKKYVPQVCTIDLHQMFFRGFLAIPGKQIQIRIVLQI